MNRMKVRSRCHYARCQSNARTEGGDQAQEKKISKKSHQKINRISDKSVIDVIKCFSGAKEVQPDDTSALPTSHKLIEKSSESSVVYIDTTYLNSDMPRNESIIDLTHSDTSLFSGWNEKVESYDISGDNIVDELHIRAPTRNSSIYTIFPAKSSRLFATPSDELCMYPLEIPKKFSKKRNRSTSDVSSCDCCCKVKRLACSRSRLSDVESTDNVWKLKRTHPLNNVSCCRRTKSGTSMNSAPKMDVNLDLMSVSESFDGIPIPRSQHSAITEDMKCLKVTNTSDV